MSRERTPGLLTYALGVPLALLTLWVLWCACMILGGQ